MAVILGFDPGGAEGFGWSIAEATPSLPLQIRATGVADSSQNAYRDVVSRLNEGEAVLAAGIDAPLFWASGGDRNVDRIIRNELRVLGARSPGGTVQSVNSLRGACLVQGIMIGVQLRAKYHALPITESHPKALLWLLRLASRQHHPAGISLYSIPQLKASNLIGGTDHERDAAIATLSAWAMINKPKGWRNLFAAEQQPFSPIEAPLAYWMSEVVNSTLEPSVDDQREQQAVLRHSMRVAAKVAKENPY